MISLSEWSGARPFRWPVPGRLGAVEGVEAAGDLAGELDVGDLVLADGDEVGLVEEDVGGLEERVAEEAVGVQAFSRSCSCWSL